MKQKALILVVIFLLIKDHQSLTISKNAINNRQGRSLSLDAACKGPDDCNKPAANNEECTAEKLCRCKDKFVEDPNPKNPRLCIPAPAKYQDECTEDNVATTDKNEDTCVTTVGQYCKSKKCECSPKHRPNPTNPPKPEDIKNNALACLAVFGVTCDTDPSVCGQAGSCMQCKANDAKIHKCDCAEKHKLDPKDPGLCAPTKGGTCKKTDDKDTLCNEECAFDGMECTDALVCDCKANMVFVEAKAGEVDKCVCTVGCPCDVKRDVCTLDRLTCTKKDGTPADMDDQPAGTQTCQCETGFVEDKDKDGKPICKAGEGTDCPEEDKAKPEVLFGTNACATGMQCFAFDTKEGKKIPNFDDHMPNGAGICSCPMGQETDQDGKCVKSLGTECTASDKCPENAECSMGKCKCMAEFVDDNGENTAGGKCSVKIGEGCPKGNECSLANQECFSSVTKAKTDAAEPKDKPGTQKCQCAATFGPNAGNDKCVASVDADCPKGDECTLPNQECKEKKCACKATFAPDAGSCHPTIGAECDPEANDCKLPNQDCDPNTKKCVASHGGTCKQDGDCPLANQECSPAKECRCKKGWEEKGGLCKEWSSNYCGGVDGGCKIGEGDCNDDSQCTDLGGKSICGVNNCHLANPGQSGRPLADCCIDPANPTGDLKDKCDGTKHPWGCCTPQRPCGEKEGDCDSDKDCKKVCASGDDCKDEDKIQLKCVPDSCGKEGAFANVFPLGQMDCCQKPTKAGFYEINYYDLYEYWKNDDEQAGQTPKY